MGCLLDGVSSPNAGAAALPCTLWQCLAIFLTLTFAGQYGHCTISWRTIDFRIGTFALLKVGLRSTGLLEVAALAEAGAANVVCVKK